MRLSERATFNWTPPDPLKMFDCALITDQAEVPKGAYVVTVSALNVEGAPVVPHTDIWPFSSSLGAHFQYSPASERFTSLALKRWEGASFVSSVHLEVVGWLKEHDAPEVLAVAFSTADGTDHTSRIWTLVRPNEKVNE